MSDRPPARPAPSTLAVVCGFLGVTACLLGFGVLAAAIRDSSTGTIDDVATPLLHGLATPELDAVMQTATFLGSDLVIVPAAIVAVAVLVGLGRRREALFLAVVGIGSLLLNGAMKVFFQRPRPQVPWAHLLPDYSFPSGHAMISLAFLLALAIVVWRARGGRSGAAAMAGAVVGALIVGVSRVYLGDHYLTDVVGGYLAAILWVLVVLGAFGGGRRLLDWRGRPAALADGMSLQGPRPGAR